MAHRAPAAWAERARHTRAPSSYACRATDPGFCRGAADATEEEWIVRDHGPNSDRAVADGPDTAQRLNVLAYSGSQRHSRSVQTPGTTVVASPRPGRLPYPRTASRYSSIP